METCNWSDWVGLPHEVGADPLQGKSACCLQIAKILLSQEGLSTPPIEPLLERARFRDWPGLTAAFNSLSEPLEGPEPLALTLITNGRFGLGLGVVVENGRLLVPHHRKGVVAIPLDLLKPLVYRRLKREVKP